LTALCRALTFGRGFLAKNARAAVEHLFARA